jgi:hypothetical protein
MAMPLQRFSEHGVAPAKFDGGVNRESRLPERPTGALRGLAFAIAIAIPFWSLVYLLVRMR